MVPCLTVGYSLPIVLLPLAVNTVAWSWISTQVNPTRFTLTPYPSQRLTD